MHMRSFRRYVKNMTSTYIYIYIYMYVFVFVCVCMCACVCVCVCVKLHFSIHPYVLRDKVFAKILTILHN